MDWGTLHLPTSPGTLPPAVWADVVVNRILVVAMLAAALLVLRDYFRLWPLLTGCLVRSRGNVEIEHSLGMARSRNRCGLVGLGILAILADRYCLYPAAFLSGLAPGVRTAALLGILVAWLLMRAILAAIFRRAKLDSEARAASSHALWNYLIAALPLMLLSAAIFWLFHIEDMAARVILWAELAVVLAITLFREGQILSGKYFVLQTFLYLCGLELIPLATLIAVAAVL